MLSAFTAFTAAASLASLASALPVSDRAAVTPRALAVTENYLPFTRVKVPYRTGALGRRSGVHAGITAIDYGMEFMTNITVGGKSYQTVIDTGSSDTWLVEEGYECVDISTGAKQAESACNMGSPMPSSAVTKIADENFNITYGGGEYLSGYMAKADIGIAGITVKGQHMGVVNSAGWAGVGDASGLLGLAYPSLTSAYAGTDGSNDGNEAATVYNPIFTTMYEDKLVDSYFSLAITHADFGDGGYIAFGGLPPVTTTGSWVTTDIVETTSGSSDHAYYAVKPDGVTLAGKNITGSSGDVYIVDSGTVLNYVPDAVAEKINAAFEPAATYSDTYGGYVVRCDATTPTVGFSFGGKIVTTDAKSLLIPLGIQENGHDMCNTGVSKGSPMAAYDMYMLGDVFLKGLVSVFDVGNNQMRFAHMASSS